MSASYATLPAITLPCLSDCGLRMKQLSTVCITPLFADNMTSWHLRSYRAKMDEADNVYIARCRTLPHAAKEGGQVGGMEQRATMHTT
ncbi:hypothetical protein BAUCODRAFT_333087 [Baudoinia panamericana UAMH 10762]|uniref:Uncharacterized protein n=1 Tax=Baudoinia panamericana (strain UAMH 10762) TaxID=717646 RepID=M2LB26_BAUPA|nr:uncharacterized protein BAUCODRAFT_333087 [Baudoinia panamericana UAMH 10762]EMC91007.1 hypothetical protein BAUCODRAFT_333087 [Baudoinia panamericana UAMH 10762]